MKLNITSAWVIVLGLFAVSFSPSTLFAADVEAEAKLLVNLDGDWSAAAEKKDIELLASYYADDAVASPPNSPAAVGRLAAKNVWARYFSAPNFTISWAPLHAEVSASADLGFTSGRYKNSFSGADGKLGGDTGNYLCVWKKGKDGKWKAIHDMWNSDLRK